MENKTALKTWLKSTGRKQGWLAEQIGMCSHTVGRYAKGKVKPSKATRVLIERITDGSVPADGWE